MPQIVITIIVCFIASLFAGIGTGFVGMSAAVAITPILMTFLGDNSVIGTSLGITHFEATAIALASDVLASLVAGIIYKRHKNTSFRKSWVLFVSVIVFSIVGTIVGYWIPSEAMGWGTVITITLMGLKLIIFPVKTKEKEAKQLTPFKKNLFSILFGAVIGFVCGFVGAGGGMMLLLVLTMVLGYDMHKAVGTSVIIMAYSACIGSASHIGYQGLMQGNLNSMNWIVFGLCAAFTLVFSLIGSKIANKLSEKTVNYVSGAILLIIAVTVFTVSMLQ